MKTESNIPRYKASMPCQIKFVTNNDACGDNIFSQVKREGAVAIYKRTDMEGKGIQFEVVNLKTVKAGTVFAKGAKPVENDYESYPGAKGWGKTGWTVNDLGRAEVKMKEILTGEVATPDVDEETAEVETKVIAPKATRKAPSKESDLSGIKIPAGEFVRLDLAVLNGMPVPCNAVSYGAIVKLLAAGKIKEVKKQTGGKGKPKTVYVAV